MDSFSNTGLIVKINKALPVAGVYAGHLYDPKSGFTYYLHPETDPAKWTDPVDILVREEHTLDLYRRGKEIKHGTRGDWAKMMEDRIPVIAKDPWTAEKAGLITLLDRAGFYFALIADWDRSHELAWTVNRKYTYDLVSTDLATVYGVEHLGTFHPGVASLALILKS